MKMCHSSVLLKTCPEMILIGFLLPSLSFSDTVQSSQTFLAV